MSKIHNVHLSALLCLEQTLGCSFGLLAELEAVQIHMNFIVSSAVYLFLVSAT